MPLRSFLQGIYDVLRPGGVAAVIEHEGDADVDNNADLHRMPADEALCLLEEVGFDVEKESMKDERGKKRGAEKRFLPPFFASFIDVSVSVCVYCLGPSLAVHS